MQIIEQFISGKKSDPSLCEDGLFISNDFIAVIDGVTAKSNTLFDGMAGGKAAMEKAKEYLKDADPDFTPEELFNGLNNAIRTLYADEPTGEAAVFIVLYNIKHKKIWGLGDCQCLINGAHHSDEKIFDKIVGDVRALVLEIARIEGATDDDLIKNDIGREYITPLLKKQHLLANSNSRFGFAVLNGTPFDTEKIYRFDINDGDTVVLASDGYPKIFDTLEKSESYLKHTVDTNPLCDKEFVSTKGLVSGNSSFDDRTYIKFVV